ncbi:MAG: hypothetical protein IJU50_07075 [Lachnospiraceae bacterium]|nr:hypothetical protein [Lachnospiraceae bacterium]
MDKKKLLEELRKRFLQNGFQEAVLVSKEESGYSQDRLVTAHRGFGKLAGEAKGSFFFFEESGICLFACRLLLTEGLSEELAFPLCTQASIENAGLPLGAFAYEPSTSSLEYRFSQPISPGLSEEEILETAGSCVTLFLSVCENYVGQMSLSGL